MDLLMVRHGLAGKADPEAWPDDDLRPLTPEGRRAFKSAAKGLKRQGLFPSLVLTSPALRTRETAVILAKALGLRAGVVRPWEALHHSRSPEKALAGLKRQKLPRLAALVGHEPWLGEFLSLLIAGDTGAGLGFAKGGAALLEIPDGGARARLVLGPKGDALGKGRGRLRWLLTQDQLAALA